MAVKCGKREFLAMARPWLRACSSRHGWPRAVTTLTTTSRPSARRSPLYRGQVARLEQLRRGRRGQPAPAPHGQRVHAHGWAAGLGHHPILPDPGPVLLARRGTDAAPTGRDQ
jgi:hypothetical protein